MRGAKQSKGNREKEQQAEQDALMLSKENQESHSLVSEKQALKIIPEEKLPKCLGKAKFIQHIEGPAEVRPA